MSPAVKKTAARMVNKHGPRCLIMHNSIVSKATKMIELTLEDIDGEPGVTIYMIQATLVFLRNTARSAGLTSVNALSNILAPITKDLEGEDKSYQKYYEELQKKVKKLNGVTYTVPMPGSYTIREIAGSLKELSSHCAVATDSQLTSAVDLLRTDHAIQLNGQQLKGMFTTIAIPTDDEDETPAPKITKRKRAIGTDAAVETDAGEGENDGTLEQKTPKKSKKSRAKETKKAPSQHLAGGFEVDSFADKDVAKGEVNDEEYVGMFALGVEGPRAASFAPLNQNGTGSSSSAPSKRRSALSGASGDNKRSRKGKALLGQKLSLKDASGTQGQAFPASDSKVVKQEQH
jgi:hypothetical protein